MSRFDAFLWCASRALSSDDSAALSRHAAARDQDAANVRVATATLTRDGVSVLEVRGAGDDVEEA